MAGLRGLRALVRVLLRLVVIAPLIALCLSVLVDRGANGEVRLSRFPLALLAVDSLVRTCARNSILFAVALCVGSLGLGIMLGWVLGRRSFWGRPVLRGAVLGLLAASPAIMALGLKGMLGPPHSWPWPFINPGAADRGSSLESWAGLGLWIAWLWSSLPAATALVAAAAISAVERLERSWEEAARLAGAPALRSWGTVSWPLIRTPAVRAAALVFVLGLLEPGAPLVLGLRRTLAYQIVAAASRPAPFPGLAAWCLLAGLIALLGVVGLRRLGGKPIITDSAPRDLSLRNESRPRPASFSRAAGSVAILSVWCLIAWLPVLGLARLAFSAHDAQGRSDGGSGVDWGAIAGRLGEPPILRLVVDSALVGLQVTAAIVLLFWLARSRRRPRSQAVSGQEKRRSAPIVIAPPLIVGVGVLAAAWLAEAAAAWLSDAGPGARVADSLAVCAAWLAPSSNPAAFLTVSIAWVLGPFVFVCWRANEREPRAASSAIDAARLVGASRLRAFWLGAPGAAATWLGRIVLIWSLAATNLTPALLASAGTEGPTIAPGFVILAEGVPEAQSLGAGLALGVLALDLAALAVAWACGALPRLADCQPP